MHLDCTIHQKYYFNYRIFSYILFYFIILYILLFYSITKSFSKDIDSTLSQMWLVLYRNDPNEKKLNQTFSCTLTCNVFNFIHNIYLVCKQKKVFLFNNVLLITSSYNDIDINK